MPEYLAPGVYVEEVSFRAKSIEGVSTTATGFVGPTRYGPVDITPDVITSLVEYERTYGDRQDLQLDGGSNTRPNYMWHAVRAFFENGGQRLYIARVYKPSSGEVVSLDKTRLTASPDAVPPGFAKGAVGQLRIYSRFPGAAGDMQVWITLTAGPNVLTLDGTDPAVRGVYENDLVLLTEGGPPSSPLADPFAIAVPYLKNGVRTWRFRRSGDSPAGVRELSALDPATAQIRVVTATVTVFPADPSAPSLVYPGLALDRNHRRNGAPDSLQSQFDLDQPSLRRARTS